MSIPRFQGTGVAMVTPFLENGDLDLPSLRKLIDHLILGEVEYLVVLGTTGETATLNTEEKQRIFSEVASINDGRLPLVAGIGGNDTREVSHALTAFDLDGYSAILSVSPYYNKPNQEGLFRHYLQLSESSPLPLMMYNVPGRTGMNVSADTTLRIANSCKNIFATKEASGNMDQVSRILKYKPEAFQVISGDDGVTLPMMAMGSIGVISVVANAYPLIFSRMVRHCLEGNFEAARPLHFQLIDVINSMFEEGNPSGLKAYLSEMGICGNNFRLPVAPVSRGLQTKIMELMAEVAARNVDHAKGI
jgi:4-hydroxy-tetrahydrodipicolinate synthase